MKTLNRLEKIIREVFLQPNLILRRESRADEVRGWDSLSHAVVIFAVEEEFGVEINPELEFANIGELADEIDRRLSLN